MSTHHCALSVVVAVYNVEKYLEACLETLYRQRFADVEFIVIDDGSTDRCAEICDAYAARDSRFTVVHQENKGLLLARKAGVERSQGKWLIFVDGDDLLAENAVEEMVQLAERHQADIVHFSVDIINCKATEQYSTAYSFFNRRIRQRVYGNKEIARETFIDKAYSWALWNKIYKTDLLKTAYEHTVNQHCVSCEDAYAYFLCCYFASSLVSEATRPLYFYRFNVGISTKKETLPLFRSHIGEIVITRWLADFLHHEQALPVWQDYLESLRSYLRDAAVYRMAALPDEDLKEALPHLCRHHDLSACLPVLQTCFMGRQNALAAAARTVWDDIPGSPSFPAAAQDAAGQRTVGIFYHRYYNGGVERVISLHIPLFRQLGYRIVLFTEQYLPEKEYPLPQDVIRCQLPPSYTQQRGEILLKALQEHEVDVFCHHATSSALILFDLLLLRFVRVPSVILCHETSAQQMAVGFPYSFCRPLVYALADSVLVLSRSEEYFYRQCGVNARYLPNPIPTFHTAESPQREDTAPPVVLWLGRLDNGQKNYCEALQIFEKILAAEDRAVCYLVGSGDPQDNKFVRRFIAQHDLHDRLIHVPYTQDVARFYSMATVHLLTSTFEFFPMVIAENKMAGLPLVTYEMPYLEMLREKKGYISVPRHDVQGAADAVLSILKDSAYALRLSQEARESIQPFLAVDLAGAWRDILEHPTQQHGPLPSKEERQLALTFWEHTLSMYNEGINKVPPAFKTRIKRRCKRLLKENPIIRPALNFLLPPGTARRQTVRSIAVSCYRILKKLV